MQPGSQTPAENPEATIDQKVAVFEAAGNGPEASAEYRASLEAAAANQAEEQAADQAEEAAAAAVESAPFINAATVLRSGSGTETKFAAIADVLDLMAQNW